VLVEGPTHGVLVLKSAGDFVFVPDANYSGSDSFTYCANDGMVFGNQATVTLNIAKSTIRPPSSQDLA
jgi:hypothetical protein